MKKFRITLCIMLMVISLSQFNGSEIRAMADICEGYGCVGY